MKSGVQVVANIRFNLRRVQTGSKKLITMTGSFKVNPSVYHYDDPIKLGYEIQYLSNLKGLAEARKYMEEANAIAPTYSGIASVFTVVVEADIIETDEKG